jgi:hypothetical protein
MKDNNESEIKISAVFNFYFQNIFMLSHVSLHRQQQQITRSSRQAPEIAELSWCLLI